MGSLKITPITKNWYIATMTLGRPLVFYGYTWTQAFSKAQANFEQAINDLDEAILDLENKVGKNKKPPRKLPVFFDDGVGIDRDNLGYIVVYGNAEKYALTPQRYKTFELAEVSIQDEL